MSNLVLLDTMMTCIRCLFQIRKTCRVRNVTVRSTAYNTRASYYDIVLTQYIRIDRPTLLSNEQLSLGLQFSLHNKKHGVRSERLVLLPRFYTMGRLSNTGDGFQLGYRWLSVRANDPLVAKSLCRRKGKSCGLAAILASSSDIGMYVTSSFLPVFSSYALKTSLNDYE